MTRIKRHRTKFNAPPDTGVIHLLGSSRGQYLPRDTLDCLDYRIWQPWNMVTALVLADPDNALYWETWERFLDTQYATDMQGRRWTLLHDGDLFAVCFEAMTSEEKESFDLVLDA